jgi:hypothetical protein
MRQQAHIIPQGKCKVTHAALTKPTIVATVLFDSKAGKRKYSDTNILACGI